MILQWLTCVVGRLAIDRPLTRRPSPTYSDGSNEANRRRRRRLHHPGEITIDAKEQPTRTSTLESFRVTEGSRSAILP